MNLAILNLFSGIAPSALCESCRRRDFTDNLEVLPATRGLGHIHTACRWKESGLCQCPQCAGTGEVNADGRPAQRRDGDRIASYAKSFGYTHWPKTVLCAACGRRDFTENMEERYGHPELRHGVPWTHWYHMHTECRRRRDGLIACPNCAGKGESAKAEAPGG